MSRRRRPFTPGLRDFISKVITPTVLVLGVLLLVYVNFSSVLKASQVTNNQFLGLVAFNQGNFGYRFQETSGIDRPALRYAGINMLSYAEWSSTASVDGDVQELWNNQHGYDTDQKKPQVYSTISADAWQLNETVSLVNDHTMTVTFQFVARPAPGAPAPTHYVFDIAHVVPSPYEWYDVKTGNTTFTTQVIQGNGVPTSTSKPTSLGTLTLSATGPALHTPAITLKNNTAVTDSTGSTTLAQAFYTEYQVTNPTAFQLITLGTETLTFQSGSASAGSPLPGSVPVPGPSPVVPGH